LQTFADPEQLFPSGAVDAVHYRDAAHYQHTTLGMAALKAGLHIMVEKPISGSQKPTRNGSSPAPRRIQSSFLAECFNCALSRAI